MIKSTAIDPVGGRRRRRLSQDRPGARLHAASATPSRRSRARARSACRPGDVLVLICRGPLGAGMEEIYQITSALKHLSLGQASRGAHRRALLRRLHRRLHRPRRPRGAGRRARSAGCVDGDLVRIVVDRNRLEGSVDLVGHGETIFGARGRRARAGGPAAAARPRARPGPARRHAALGRASAGGRRDLGRLRLRRGRDLRQGRLLRRLLTLAAERRARISSEAALSRFARSFTTKLWNWMTTEGSSRSSRAKRSALSR